MADNEKNFETEGGFPFKLSKPARQALIHAGYTRLEQLAGLKEADIAKLHGMGPKTIVQLREALAAKGMPFAEGK
ncbi:MAG: DNA-binding protein [Paenibacillaceae bacterium]|nr:DNA-binding protein [Paenibacillaceae bacterium]